MADNNDNELNSEDRDQVMLHIIERDKAKLRHANSHLGDLADRKRSTNYWSEAKDDARPYRYWTEYNSIVESTHGIAMVMLPAWGVIFPPYNIARLTGLLRHSGYGVGVHDINVTAYHHLKKQHNVDYWDSQNYFKWEQPVYSEEVHPLLKPHIDKHIRKILDEGHTFIGFSLYLTNLFPTLYTIRAIKELAPEKVIIVGGPEAFNDWFDELVHEEHKFPRGLIDYVVKGEGEQELLTILENHHTIPDSNAITYFGGLKSNLDLNTLPFPDYSDYDLDLYEHADGVSIETSRGCVAKCTFCAETHFWKYRWRESNRVADEMEYQVNKYGINRFWFVDSLANGNIHEFRNLVDEILNRKLDIRWNSYARCDGRMDLELFHKIADSGCISLSFGVESGSERVLQDMKKLISVKEIEDNLRDASIVGLASHVNWVVGFPTETPGDWLHSLVVLYNTRKWIYAISPGMTCGDAAFSDINVNWAKYELQWLEKPWDNTFMSNWWTKDYANTIIHRGIRLKFMNIWLRILQDEAGATLVNGQNRKNITDFYSFSHNGVSLPEGIKQYWNTNMDKFGKGFSNSIANEYLPMAVALHSVFGDYEFKLNTTPELDIAEFGGFIGTHYTASLSLSVVDSVLKFELSHSFDHATSRDDVNVALHEVTREDMSFDTQYYSFELPMSSFSGAPVHSVTHNIIPTVTN